MGRLFGTDGVRGVANQELTGELAYAIGRAAAGVLAAGNGERGKFVVGRDTRISGDMLQAALSAGVVSTGVDVLDVGVIPTPGVAFLTRDLQADAGAVISASHNPIEDNGIKILSSGGMKLPDEVESAVESQLFADADNEAKGAPGLPRPTGGGIGRIYRVDDGMDRYIDMLIDAVDVDLTGMKIVLDCANGAAFRVAPTVFRRLGANVAALNTQPDGLNINVKCGSTFPEVIQQAVQEHKADLGLTFDGDADRVLAVDHRGRLVDGDHILAICGTSRLHGGTLPNKAIAATVYSNLGLKKAMEDAGGRVVTTKAGDRYVLEALLQSDLVLGGEKSGHIIFLENNTTGDGVLTGLKLLETVAQSSQSLADLRQVMTPFPQILLNVKVRDKSKLQGHKGVEAAIRAAEARLDTDGRVFVRASGTEPIVRVMGEGPDREVVEKTVRELADAISDLLG